MAEPTTNTLRRRIREKRGALSDCDRESAALAAFDHLAATRVLRRSRRIAAYISFDGELDTAPVIGALLETGKPIFLPVIDKQNVMRFARFDESTDLSNNRFGIPEPDWSAATLINPRWLDTVITPLVAFDSRGNRIGMGAGYYDRCFAFLLHRSIWRKPKLIGYAYEFQHREHLATNSWDVPLDCIVTDERVHNPQQRGRAPGS